MTALLPSSLTAALSELTRPIGVFDSGVGGLTVLKALREALPKRDFVYLGDTARLPYGRKPRDMVAGFARGNTNFLVGLGVEAVVVACNTAASSAPNLGREFPVPMFDVISPGVEAARRRTRDGHVGVIATKGTVAAGAYQARLEAQGLRVWAKACPMFVPIVEEGLTDSEEARLLADLYLRGRPEIDTLILGCTHYPVLRNVLQETVGTTVQLVDSAEVTAEVVRAALGSEGSGSGRIVHLVTGDTVAYEHTARNIGGVDGVVIHLDVTHLVAAETAHKEAHVAR
ncbi:glutamate racemase [Deinococcus yavapaiensis]|uniref:Glutamate racemase n=1 Tax=Deinococcus yavapaiensis KR-236 TaxID=694435 RepID=A0A318SFQ5_9DEIO|nr:glutamate racemase [Deinococcus yavapaiensis]PYE52854.1 glutamate racemase [Deinococcus yavapaiensis KR-236]